MDAKTVVLFGGQKIAADFLRHLTREPGVEVSLVVSSETERDEAFGYTSLSAAANDLGVPAVNPDRVTEIVPRIESIQPDVIFSVYYRKILPASLLEIPRLYCVNIHPSLLPRYRGPTPTAWALLNGETSFGITIHVMDEHIDTGPILAQREHSIDADETGFELHTRAMELGARLLQDSLQGILDAEIEPREQAGPASYYGKLKQPYQIDWQDSAQRIRNAVRVYAAPYSRAETAVAGHRLLINRATLVEDSRYLLQGPGRIVDIVEGDTPIVSAADGFLRLEEYEVVPALDRAKRLELLKIGARLG